MTTDPSPYPPETPANTQRSDGWMRRLVRLWDCPQCGEQTPTLNEGCCEVCREENQRRLDLHNAAFDRWEKLTDNERAEEIRRAAD